MISILSSKSLLPFTFRFYFFSSQPSTVNLLSAWSLPKPPAGSLRVFSSPVHCRQKHHTSYLPFTFTGWQAASIKSSPRSALLPRLPASGPMSFQPPAPSSTPLFHSLAKDCLLHTPLQHQAPFLPSPPHLWPQCPQEAVPSSLLPPLSSGLPALPSKPARLIICTVHQAVIMYCLVTLLFSLEQALKHASAM